MSLPAEQHAQGKELLENTSDPAGTQGVPDAWCCGYGRRVLLRKGLEELPPINQ